MNQEIGKTKRKSTKKRKKRTETVKNFWTWRLIKSWIQVWWRTWKETDDHESSCELNWLKKDSLLCDWEGMKSSTKIIWWWRKSIFKIVVNTLHEISSCDWDNPFCFQNWSEPIVVSFEVVCKMDMIMTERWVKKSIETGKRFNWRIDFERTLRKTRDIVKNEQVLWDHHHHEEDSQGHWHGKNEENMNSKMLACFWRTQLDQGKICWNGSIETLKQERNCQFDLKAK
jgi:hypothetical protein